MTPLARLLLALTLLGFAAPVDAAESDIARYHPTRFAKEPRVDVIVFSDYQCPFCARVERSLQKIGRAHARDVRIVHINRPLTFHRHARTAAVAGLAALRQGAFWRMLRDQPKLNRAKLAAHARGLGLDVARFRRDLDSGPLRAKVQQDAAIADALGVRGTPTVFVNGRRLVGAGHGEGLRAMVMGEISAANVLGRRGAAWVRARTKRRNPALVRILYDGKARDGRMLALVDLQRGIAHGDRVYKVQVLEDDPIRGNSLLSRATIVVFCDYVERDCARANLVSMRLLERFGRRVRVVWKQAPRRYYPHSEALAVGATCAARQGMFFAVHDRLLAERGRPTIDALVGHVLLAGGDPRTLLGCIRGIGPARLRKDVNAARTLGVAVTPAVFVNGRRVPIQTLTTDGERIVQQALEHADTVARPGEGADAVYARLIARGKVPHPQRRRPFIRLPTVPGHQR